MKKVITILISLFFLTLSFNVFAGDTVATNKKRKATVKNEPIVSVDTDALNERINTLIALTATQEKEIQRLSNLTETLKKKLDATTEELHATKQERDALIKQVQVFTERIKVIQQTISGIPESTVFSSQTRSEQPPQVGQGTVSVQPALPVLPQHPKNTVTGIPSGGPLPGNGGAVTTVISQTTGNSGKSNEPERTAPVQSTTQTGQKDTYRDNENLHMSLARAAASTGQPVYIQQGQYSLIGEPIQGDRCNATVTVKQGSEVIREKKYNVCNNN